MRVPPDTGGICDSPLCAVRSQAYDGEQSAGRVTESFSPRSDECGMAESRIYGQLIPCGGGDPIPLSKRQLIIGRRSNCDLTLEFSNVSSQHCELELIDGYWMVRDLHSSNGTRVNDVRCENKWLFPGDILSIARHKYEVDYTPEGEPPTEGEDPFARSLMEKAGLQRRPDSAPERDALDSGTSLEAESSDEWPPTELKP